jgi:hypothetical protein
MSYNTIPIRPEDLDRKDKLYQKFKTETIKPEEVVELKQILENERYLSMSEGNLPIMISITAILTQIDNYMKKKVKSELTMKFSNVGK